MKIKTKPGQTTIKAMLVPMLMAIEPNCNRLVLRRQDSLLFSNDMKDTAQPYKITHKKYILTYNNDKIMREGLISDEEKVELGGEEKDGGNWVVRGRSCQ